MQSFWGFASILYPKGREKAIRESSTDPKPETLPEDQVGCIDNLYGVAAYYEYEWGTEMSPAWRRVGRHLRFVESMERLADEYVRRTLGVGEDDEVPEVS